MPEPRRIAGCMTGTSLDGLDLVLAEIDGRGLEVSARIAAHVSRPLGDLAGALRRLACGEPAPPIDFLRAARRLGEIHAEAIEELCAAAGGWKPDLVVAHGQTIWHAPAEGLSFQLFDPWPVARRLNAPVLYDLRQADLIAGGEGAPITPLADWALFRDAKKSRLIVNLGGIANVTFLPTAGGPDAVRAEDVSPCNILIDGAVRTLFPERSRDDDGRLAARGRPDGALGERLGAHPALLRRAKPRSLGREDFPDAWIRDLVEEARARLSPEDIVRSAVEAVAERIAATAALFAPEEVFLAGGGARNPVLVEQIRARCASARRVALTDELGVGVEAREALCFAVLGALSQDGVPITLAQATGARDPGRAGAWVYPA